MERLLGGEEEAVVGAEGRFHQVRGEQLVSVPWSRPGPALVPPQPSPGPALVPPRSRPSTGSLNHPGSH